MTKKKPSSTKSKSHKKVSHIHIHKEESNKKEEYAKFFFVMSAIFLVASLHSIWVGLDLMQFLESFMGVFFIVFAGFKLYKLKEFAYGFQSYDVIARKSLVYSYLYPLIQLLFGVLYLVGSATRTLDIIVVIVSAVSAYGVITTLQKGKKVHCVCLGNVIKLPLSTISFVEDIGMALMAIAMLAIR